MRLEPALRREAGRIAFVAGRDGESQAVEWVRRTMRTYRRAVLNRAHFASTAAYRASFIESYLDFKRWLSRVA